eukprot:gb/GECG01002996.1/.p1 GENE.gb/GECG01002996.1/~~gb/GECG01002996.1/.p1  ORF type:complete len:106 (+),score=9.98 gb/GECG01002996.1/:1-318(+)
MRREATRLNGTVAFSRLVRTATGDDDSLAPLREAECLSHSLDCPCWNETCHPDSRDPHVARELTGHVWQSTSAMKVTKSKQVDEIFNFNENYMPASAVAAMRLNG